MPYHATSYHITLHHTTSHHKTSYNIIWHHITSHHIISCHTAPLGLRHHGGLLRWQESSIEALRNYCQKVSHTRQVKDFIMFCSALLSRLHALCSVLCVLRSRSHDLVCVCVHARVCMSCVCAWMRVCVCWYECVCVFMWMCVCMCVCVHVGAYVLGHFLSSVHTHTPLPSPILLSPLLSISLFS